MEKGREVLDSNREAESFDFFYKEGLYPSMLVQAVPTIKHSTRLMNHKTFTRTAGVEEDRGLAGRMRWRWKSHWRRSEVVMRSMAVSLELGCTL